MDWALFNIQVLIERARDVNSERYACFIDFARAFDTVKHQKLITILEKIGVGIEERRIIANLYWNPNASIRTENLTISIQKGVRQECILSPLLFNIYSEEIFREALEELNVGLRINGMTINNIRYVDDSTLLGMGAAFTSHNVIKMYKLPNHATIFSAELLAIKEAIRNSLLRPSNLP